MLWYSAFEFSALILSPFIGKYLNKMGRKNAILIGDIILVRYHKILFHINNIL